MKKLVLVAANLRSDQKYFRIKMRSGREVLETMFYVFNILSSDSYFYSLSKI